MKTLLYCYDCKYFEIHSGFECPKCGSKNIEIDREIDRGDDDAYSEEEYAHFEETFLDLEGA